MDYNDVEYTKSTCEKYTLRLNDGWDYAAITIDNTGIFQCHSSIGNYSYHWNAFGDNFKKFLCRIDSHYLINKVANEDYFDFGKYQEKAKGVILEERKDGNLTKEDARELWDFITDDIDYTSSYDLVCSQIFENDIANKLYGGEVFFSDLSPEQDYSPRAKAFAFKLFPKFVEILKQELNQQSDEIAGGSED